MSCRIERVVARMLLMALCLFGAGTAVRAAAEPSELVRVEARQSPGRSDRSDRSVRRHDERRAPQAVLPSKPPAESDGSGVSSLEPPGRLSPAGPRFALFLRDRALLI